MKKVVYVTGCLGFIGSYVTRYCLHQGWYVRGVDKVTYAANLEYLEEFNKSPNFVFERKDINDIEFLYDCDYIINTAAETHVGNSITNSDLFVHSNVNGVHHLLELLRGYRAENSGKPVLLHFSSDEVYGDITDGEHIETDLLKPSNPYSATKAAGDMLVLAWARTYDIPYVIVRPTNNYGIGQYVEKLIPKAIKFLSLGRKIPVHDKGLPIRNWLHAGDTAQAVVDIINCGAKNEIYNICGGFEQRNIDTVKKTVNEFFQNENIDIDNHMDYSYNRSGQDVRYALNDDKLRSIGWSPNANFDQELPHIVKYYKNNFIW